MSYAAVPVENDDYCSWQGNTREVPCLRKDLRFHPVNQTMVKVKVQAEVSYIKENFVPVSFVCLIRPTPFKSVFNYQYIVHTVVLGLDTVINSNKSERNNTGSPLHKNDTP
jgi:hypothetical protein